MGRIDWKNWAPPGRDARQEAESVFGCLTIVTLLSWILFAIVLVLTLIQLKLSRRWVYYEE